VQKHSGDAVVALLRPQNRALPQTSAQHKSRFSTSVFAKQGNQGRAKDNREDHCTPGKDPNGVPWKNLSRYCTVRRLPENSLLLCFALSSSFLELAKGIEPPTL
jgi:hypothetical protein